MATHTATPDASTGAPQRTEIITGHERRRQYTDEDKARLVAETTRSGESVYSVARRDGICTWLILAKITPFPNLKSRRRARILSRNIVVDISRNFRDRIG
jgi:hypothetical protein